VPQSESWQLVTWNVNSLRAHLPGVLAWLDDHQPDVVALQETMCDERNFPGPPFLDRGYAVLAAGRGGGGGVALLSRVGLDNPERGIPGATAPFDEPRLVSATCAGVRVVNLYAPNGRKVGTDPHRLKLAWFSFLGQMLDDDAAGDLLLVGDLNIAPTDRDVWDASRYRYRNLTSPAERRAFAELCSIGLTDVVRRDAGDSAVLSSWWNRRGDFFDSDRGWRLDHVLASTSMAARCRFDRIDRTGRERAATDHAPIVVTIER
jgi:exodeoxyribonuclease III